MILLPLACRPDPEGRPDPITPSHTADEGPGDRGPDVTWFDDQEGNTAGRGLWVGDVDGDAALDVVIGAPSFGGVYGVTTRSTAYRLEVGAPAGVLSAVAAQRLPGIGQEDLWGDFVTGLPRLGLFAIAHAPDTRKRLKVALYAPAPGEVRWRDAAALVQLRDDREFPKVMAACDGVAGGTLCLAGTGGDEYAGEVRVFADPVDGRSRGHVLSVLGDPGDDAKFVHPAADLDADGVPDLVVGSTRHGGAGAVAVVPGTLTGDHGLWSSAVAVVSGQGEGSYFGTLARAGDWDGDGAADLVVTAPREGPDGLTRGFRGPFLGDRQASEADFVVAGGAGAALGDLDGDGLLDLAVAGGLGVRVHLGPLTAASVREPPAWVLGSDGDPGDGFGWRMEVGDWDEDGVDDLFVSAPYDSRGAPGGGAVHVFTGLDEREGAPR